MKNKRPRINNKITIVDIEAYTENAGSKNTRKLIDVNYNIVTEIWIDKHYSIREQHGDNSGKREGISREVVEILVKKAFLHLKYYNLKHSNFKFINFPPSGVRNIRIVLKDEFKDEDTLNVVVEYHFIDLSLYEVTVFTAMCKNDFYLSDGQYALVFENNFSRLVLMQNKNEKIIDEFNFN